MAATFGQFPANFRFSGALVGRSIVDGDEGTIIAPILLKSVFNQTSLG